MGFELFKEHQNQVRCSLKLRQHILVLLIALSKHYRAANPFYTIESFCLYRTSSRSLFMHRVKIHDYHRISVDRKAVITSFGRNAHHCRQLFAIRSIYLRAVVYMKKGTGTGNCRTWALRAWDSEKFIDANSPMNERVLVCHRCLPSDFVKSIPREFPDIEVSLSPILSGFEY